MLGLRNTKPEWLMGTPSGFGAFMTQVRSTLIVYKLLLSDLYDLLMIVCS